MCIIFFILAAIIGTIVFLLSLGPQDQKETVIIPIKKEVVEKTKEIIVPSDWKCKPEAYIYTGVSQDTKNFIDVIVEMPNFSKYL